MNILIILNEGPYTNEKAYNGLRTGIQLIEQFPDTEINFYLFSDGAGCAVPNQKPSAASYNAGDMITSLISRNATVKVCKSCMEARGISNLIDGVEVSNMTEYASLITQANKIISF